MNSVFKGASLEWRRLCRAAVIEHDPDRLAEIVWKINAMLGDRQDMLRSRSGKGSQIVLRIHSRPRRAA